MTVPASRGEHAAVLIARCPEHGLHGQREECFVCGGPVEQVPMVPHAEFVALAEREVKLTVQLRDAQRELATARGQEDICDACGGSEDVRLRGYHDDGERMQTCRECGEPSESPGQETAT